MKPKTVWYAAALLALAVAIGIPAAADEWNQKTIFTFSDSVELPGKTLPAGTYTFKLADSPSSRNIVQVLNKDETQLLMTLLAVSAERSERGDEPIVTFAERSAQAPAAVQYWFYPGRTSGHEFVYPREQAIRIARATQKPVLATDEEPITSGRVTTIDPEGREGEYADRTMSDMDHGRTPARETMQTGQAVDESTSADRRDTMSPRESDAPQSTSTDRGMSDVEAQADARELPQTASGDPILLLLAVSSFIGLSALRTLRRRW